MQFLKQHELDADPGSLAKAGFDGIEIGVSAAVVGFLEQGDLEGFLAHWIRKQAKSEW